VFEIGTSLREARLRRQIEIAQAEQATKIRAKYLRALEDEQFDQLPSPTYVKGFLRSYAEYLGLDGQLYVDEYNSRYVIGEDGPDTPFGAARRRRAEVGRRRTREHRRVESNMVLLALVAIAVVTGLIFAAWKFGGSSNSPNIPNLATTTNAGHARQPARLVIQAVAGPAALEVHAGSAAGKLLFQGTLEKGHRVSLPAKSLWLRVGATQNLRIVRAGHTLVLPHRHQLVILQSGAVHPAA
jgi:hypothetical protein